MPSGTSTFRSWSPDRSPPISTACRATQDADLVLELNRLPIDAFAQRLAAHFDVDSRIAFETVTGSRRIVARARDSAFQVELFDSPTTLMTVSDSPADVMSTCWAER